MNKYLKYTLIFATVGVTGVVGYFVYKKIKDRKSRRNADLLLNQNNNTNTDTSTNTDTKKTNTSTGSKLGAMIGGAISSVKVPFTQAKTGNFFRSWVNDTFPNYAKQIDLDKTGSYNNSYIKSAWAKYGDKYKLALSFNLNKAGVPFPLALDNAPDYVKNKFW